MSAIRRPAATSSRPSRAIYKFVSNKWYFDELYDRIFVRPALWLGRLFWHGGDEGTIDRFGPHGAAYAVGVGNRITVPAPVGLSLFLCAGDAARPDRRGELGDLVGQVSGIAAAEPADRLPADRRRAVPVRPGRGRALDRADRDADRFRAQHLPLGQYDPAARSGSSRELPHRRRCQLGTGHRRHRADADRPDRLPDAHLHRRELARDREARPRIHGLFPADGGADHGRPSQRRTCSCSTSSSRAASSRCT